MLDVESGYEGKFDFAAPGTPAITYMLATVPRTGSSWFGHMLWETGCLGAPIEYLNFEAGDYSFARHSTAQQDRLWRSVRQRRTSANGVFGFKCFPMELEALKERNPGLLDAVMDTVMAGAPPRIVHLQRRDRVAHAVSYARATLSGVWRAQQEAGQGEQIDYSEAAMATAERWIETQQGAWEDMFREMRIAPLTLWYEDALADPAGAARQVAAYLGVTIDPAARVRVPEIRKQAEGDARRWAERHAGVKSAA
jgi:LPS sulfotransferase NodH